MSNGLYIYSIIRKDISLADQIVQTAHSAFHAGDESTLCLELGETPSLILLEVKNQEELLALSARLEQHNIRHYKFFEPDDNLGYTSLTTEPLSANERKLFSNLRLWRP